MTLVFAGRPLEILPILDDSDAILYAWHLGDASGRALADLLTGKVSPSGRLSMSIPYSVGQVPVHYNPYRTGRPAKGQKIRYVSRYLDCENEALFPFGYGLSYASFAYRNLEVEAVEGDAEVVAKARITVENTSDCAAMETVQLYIRDVAAQLVRPIKELKGFRKITLAPGESQTVEFTLTRESLGYWNPENKFIYEPGEFEIMAGPNSAETQGVTMNLS